LNERDTIRAKHEPPRGILNVRPAEAAKGVSRYWPSADLAPFVEHYWVVRWDEPAPRLAETVPHPSVHLVLETNGRAEIVGVMRTRFSRVLEGKGRVLGTKFRPGAFRPFVDRPVSAFTDRRPTVRDAFGPRAHGLCERALASDDDRDGIAVVEAFLRASRPVADDAMALVGRVAARVADDRRITRVEAVVSEFGVPLRRLQRLFGEYVGVSPKWVIQRYRLVDAAARVAEGAFVDWAGLALDLGYADQAHFIRDFKRLVGRPPAEYARSLVPIEAPATSDRPRRAAGRPARPPSGRS
jgi:AraC-like DNA-binding protein